MTDLDHVFRVAQWMAGVHPFERIAALHEKDLLIAARLREQYAIEGPSVEQILPYRDKYMMKIKAQKAGIPVPRFALGTVDRVSWEGPTVSKDRWGLGASSIRYWPNTGSALAGVQAGKHNPADVLIEERIDGEMYDCDSIVVGGQILFSNVSRYAKALGDFADLEWNATITPVDDDIDSEVRRLNESTLTALGRHDSVTHAEFFRDAEGRYLLCEVAARPGGGGTDALIRHATGVDVVAAALAIGEGRIPTVERVHREGVYMMLGLYPAKQAIPARLIDGVKYYQLLSSGRLGGPRHSGDFDELYILSASDESSARDLLRSALSATGRVFS